MANIETSYYIHTIINNKIDSLSLSPNNLLTDPEESSIHINTGPTRRTLDGDTQ